MKMGGGSFSGLLRDPYDSGYLVLQGLDMRCRTTRGFAVLGPLGSGSGRLPNAQLRLHWIIGIDRGSKRVQLSPNGMPQPASEVRGYSNMTLRPIILRKPAFIPPLPVSLTLKTDGTTPPAPSEGFVSTPFNMPSADQRTVFSCA